MAMPKGEALVRWSADADDRRFLADHPDWSALQGIDGLWPVLAGRHGAITALEASHGPAPERLSYEALAERIAVAAAGFRSLGVEAGDVVALFAENGPRWLAADQGLMRLGAVDAVRGATAPLEELRFLLDDSRAVGLVLEDPTRLAELLADGAGAGLRFVLLLHGEPPAGVSGVHRWEDLLARGAAAPLRQPFEGDPARTATLLYTSGTTGRPKGVPLSHANLLHQVRELGVAVNPQPGDRVLSVLPIWHAYERSAGYLLLSRGCSQHYTSLRHLRADLQRVRPQYMISVPRLWEALHGGFCTALEGMPPLRRRLLQTALAIGGGHARQRRRWRDLVERPLALPERLGALAAAMVTAPGAWLAARLFWPKVRDQLCGGSLRTAISGGGALPLHVDLFFETIGIELLVGYGLTETSPVLCCRRLWANRRGSAGRPLPGTDLRIVDPESRRPLGWGERGLVLARGPQVMAGYLGRPDATAAVLDADGWFDTGDLGHLLPDGSLFLTGRAKDTIVLSSGENIEPGPLEDVLAASPLLEQILLVGQDRRQLGALLVPRLEALEAWARDQVPSALGPDGLRRDDPALLKALRSDCNRQLAARPGSRPDERLAGVALVEPFTIENGLLTQTLKQRRDRIATRDAAAIEAIYAEG